MEKASTLVIAALVKLIPHTQNITLTKKIGHKGRKEFEKSYDIDISATKFVKLLKDKIYFEKRNLILI